MLTKDEWELLNSLCTLLEGFAEATTYLGGSKYVTHSIMSPLLKKIKNHIRPTNIRLYNNININKIIDVFEEEKEGEQTEYEETECIQNLPKKLNLNTPFVIINVLEKVKTNLYNAIEFYWDEKEEEILISALLDPRIKSLKFVEEKVCDEVKELLKSKYNQLKTDSLLATIRQLLATTSYTPSTPSFTQPSLFSIFGKNASQQHDDEITIYLSLPELDFEYDLFV